MTTPLLDRIAARVAERDAAKIVAPRPTPFEPRWKARLRAVDQTAAIYDNGNWRPRGSERSA
jgi:hypothetical protein